METADKLNFGCQWKSNAMVSGGNLQKWSNGSVSLVQKDTMWNIEFYIHVKGNIPKAVYKLTNNIDNVKLQSEDHVILTLKESGGSTTLRMQELKSGAKKLYEKLQQIRIACPTKPTFLRGTNIQNKQNTPSKMSSPNDFMSTSPIFSRTPQNRISDGNNVSKSADVASQVRNNKVLSESCNFTKSELEISENSLSGRKPNNFLNSAQEKSQEMLTGSFYGNKTVQSVFGSTYGSSTGKRKPGLLPNPTPDLKRTRLTPSRSFLTNTKQTTLEDSLKWQSTLQGFSNLGNTCYMNAILQSLFCLDSFSADLLAVAKNKTVNGSTENQSLLHIALARLLQASFKPNVEYNRENLLSKVKDSISKTAKRFSGHEQHDAHEFLSQLLDQLKEEVSKLPDDPVKPLRTETQSSNPTVLNFESEIQQTITCLRCKGEHTSNFILNDISLDVPRMFRTISIQECLRHYFKPHNVDYTCSSCQYHESVVTYKFSRLPRVLIVLLKRYQFSQSTVSQKKIVHNVFIPKFVTLKEQCMEETCPPHPAPRPFIPEEHRPKKFIHQPFRVHNNQNDSKKDDHAVPSIEEDDDFLPSYKIRPKLAEKRHAELDLFGEDELPSPFPILKPLSNNRVVGEIFFNGNSDDIENLNHYATENGTHGNFETKSSNTNGNSLYDSFNLKDIPEEEQLQMAINLSRNETKNPFMVDSSCQSTAECIEQNGILVSPVTPVKRSASPEFNSSRHTVLPSLFTPDHPKYSGNANESRVSKNLFSVPVTDRKLHDSNFDGISEFNNNNIDVVNDHSTSTPTRALPTPLKSDGEAEISGSGFPRRTLQYRLDDEASAAEDKENMLPDLIDVASNTDHAKELESTGTDEHRQTQAEFDADLKRAIEMSLQSIGGGEEDIEKAKQLSLAAFEENNKCTEQLFDDEDEQALLDEAEKTELDAELAKNAESGDLPYSYQLVSIVSHLGSSSSAGHYVSDIYNIRKGLWRTCDDSDVSLSVENEVRKRRERTGYIFFYLAKDLLDDLVNFYKQTGNQQQLQQL